MNNQMRKFLGTMTVLFSFMGVGHAAAPAGKTVVDMEVAEKGFQPKSINVKPGSDVVLRITRKTDVTCSTEIQIPSKKVKVALPLNKSVDIALGKVEKGEIKFGCGMDMMDAGVVTVK